MYLWMTILLIFVFPVASVLVEAFLFHSGAGLALLVGKWFVFWAVGIRLFLAGLRQALTPRFTAEEIFGIKAPEPLVIVQELGFANLSMGLVGLLTVLNGLWVAPAGIAGGLFYGLAGIKHATRKERNLLENVATVSDLFIFVVLLVYLIVAVRQ
jgi:hypothetical protein